MYTIYDDKNNGECVGVFDTYEQAGNAIGLSADAVYYAIKRDGVMKKRYTASKIKEA